VIRLASFVVGLIFAAGLVLGGMTQPLKVIAFLDFTSGAWDPSLALVMGGALVVYFMGFRFATSRPRPVLAESFSVPTDRSMPPRLFVGAAIFGIGWALSGFCPGPAIVSVGAGMREAFYFLPAMVAGMLLFRAWDGTPTPPVGSDDREVQQ
jgi:hypothetical protein